MLSCDFEQDVPLRIKMGFTLKFTVSAWTNFSEPQLNHCWMQERKVFGLWLLSNFSIWRGNKKCNFLKFEWISDFFWNWQQNSNQNRFKALSPSPDVNCTPRASGTIRRSVHFISWHVQQCTTTDSLNQTKGFEQSIQDKLILLANALDLNLTFQNGSRSRTSLLYIRLFHVLG